MTITIDDHYYITITIFLFHESPHGHGQVRFACRRGFHPSSGHAFGRCSVDGWCSMAGAGADAEKSGGMSTGSDHLDVLPEGNHQMEDLRMIFAAIR